MQDCAWAFAPTNSRPQYSDAVRILSRSLSKDQFSHVMKYRLVIGERLSHAAQSRQQC